MSNKLLDAESLLELFWSDSADDENLSGRNAANLTTLSSTKFVSSRSTA